MSDEDPAMAMWTRVKAKAPWKRKNAKLLANRFWSVLHNCGKLCPTFPLLRCFYTIICLEAGLVTTAFEKRRGLKLLPAIQAEAASSSTKSSVESHVEKTMRVELVRRGRRSREQVPG